MYVLDKKKYSFLFEKKSFLHYLKKKFRRVAMPSINHLTVIDGVCGGAIKNGRFDRGWVIMDVRQA
jgi:hypothetical protein